MTPRASLVTTPSISLAIVSPTLVSCHCLYKVDAITHFKPLITVKGLHEFVNRANFYWRLIPAAAQMMVPLFEALAGKPKTLVWDEVMAEAF